jgi:hypothetical protein
MTLTAAISVAAASLMHGNMISPMPRSMHGQVYDDRNKCGSTDPYSNATHPGNYCGMGCLGEACLYYQIGCFSGCGTCAMVGKDLYPTAADLAAAGNCKPTAPTLPDALRTYNVDGESWKGDWTAVNPWRSPGLTGTDNGVVNKAFQPCGVNSGGSNAFPGPGTGTEPHSVPGTDLPRLLSKPDVWKVGAAVPVEWSIYANHGGGYSYRICKVDGTAAPTEECFQKTPLAFASPNTTVVYVDGSHPTVSFAAMTTSVGTWPAGSQWRRNPVPMCNCDIGLDCGEKAAPAKHESSKQAKPAARPAPLSGGTGVSSFEVDVAGAGPGCTAVPNKAACGTKYTDNCLACAAGEAWDCTECCPGCTQVTKGEYTYCTCDGPGPKPDPHKGFYTPYKTTHLKPGQQTPRCPTGLMFPTADGWDEGYGEGTSSVLGAVRMPYKMIDTVRVPDVAPGAYQLSWRWDTEQTPQVWNSCADIIISA